MVAAETTMEARLSAIMASLIESRALLASSIRRLEEREGQVATTTRLMFGQDRVREKTETKPLSSSLISTHRDLSVGALHAETVLAPARPTRCSTNCLASNVGNHQAAVAIPARGMAPVPSAADTQVQSTATLLVKETIAATSVLIDTVVASPMCHEKVQQHHALEVFDGMFEVTQNQRNPCRIIKWVPRVRITRRPVWWTPRRKYCHFLPPPPPRPPDQQYSGQEQAHKLLLWPSFQFVIPCKCNLELMLAATQPWCRSVFSPGSSLQFLATKHWFMLSLGELWCWHDNNDARNEKRNLGGTVLYACHGLIQFARMQENGNQCSHTFRDAVLVLATNREVVLDCNIKFSVSITLPWDPGVGNQLGREELQSGVPAPESLLLSACRYVISLRCISELMPPEKKPWFQNACSSEFEKQRHMVQWFSYASQSSGQIVSNGHHMMFPSLLKQWKLSTELSAVGATYENLSSTPFPDCEFGSKLTYFTLSAQRELFEGQSVLYLYGSVITGGKFCSVDQLLGQNLSLTKDKEMHMIWRISVPTATSVRANARMDLFEISEENSVLILNHELNTHVIAIMLVVPCVEVLDAHIQWDPGGLSPTMNGDQEPNHAERSRRMQWICARGYWLIIGLDGLSVPWDLGIISLDASAVPVHAKARRTHCRSWSYTLLQPAHAIACGQAMFCRGGSVTPDAHLDDGLLVWARPNRSSHGDVRIKGHRRSTGEASNRND